MISGTRRLTRTLHRYPSGARTTVIVNGTVVIENATHTGATPGIVLRRIIDGSVS